MPKENTDNRSLTTVTTFSRLQDAVQARTLLEAAGLYVFVKDETTARIAPHYNVDSGVPVQVAKEDVEKAIQVLKDAGMMTK